MKILLLEPRRRDTDGQTDGADRFLPTFLLFLFRFVGEAAAASFRKQHVGEHGRASAPGHDQPVCFDGGLRRRSGEAAPPGGPLAVRDGVELLLPGGQHPRSPPPDDGDSQKHSRHAAQLPRRHHHVLQAASVRLRLRSVPVGGLLPSASVLQLRLLLGLVAAEPPAGLVASVVPHRTSLPPPDARVAAGVAAQRSPAAGRRPGAERTQMRRKEERRQNSCFSVCGPEPSRSGLSEPRQESSRHNRL